MLGARLETGVEGTRHGVTETGRRVRENRVKLEKASRTKSTRGAPSFRRHPI